MHYYRGKGAWKMESWFWAAVICPLMEVLILRRKKRMGTCGTCSHLG